MWINVSDAEHATILAALRTYQAHPTLSRERQRYIDDIAPSALDDDQIDVLCEKLNTEYVDNSGVTR